MQSVADEVAHKKMMKGKYSETVAAEDEVLFMGQDAYVPRLVASTAPIVKPAEHVSPQDGVMFRPCYAENPKGNRPAFTRGPGGVPSLKTRQDAEPHVFPMSAVTGI
eukprot:CAMPEP_0206477588 /NCGR_PEP_ID=MMETSP0324_2-20121206/35485_1 /ASSEMBLY_ACC=CAM_ASM_000836 /TAXON_ID=2866 /ORGANISM="Crypthecodinium cohnii, Strain Seligo" /LENGTH=106 /DNA_ID=CAMNT_0053953607 /DNA_START=133 /DNA_END=453 /DNA_ORIENTATION=+